MVANTGPVKKLSRDISDMSARAMWNLRPMVACLVLLLGMASAQTARFATVQEAVQTLPELSVLNAQVSKISLADKLKDPNFVGTVFAPINSGLQPLLNALGGDITVLGTSAQVNDVFSTSVFTSKVMLEELQDGQTLTSMNGNRVTVTVQSVNGGRVYYVNKARITTANILAGKAVIHEVTPILVPSSYQSMLDMIGVKDTSPVTPTALYTNPTSPSPSPSLSPSPSPLPSPSPSPQTQPSSSPAPSTGSGTSGSPSGSSTGSITTGPSNSTSTNATDSGAGNSTDGMPVGTTSTAVNNLVNGTGSTTTGSTLTNTSGLAKPAGASDSGLKDPNLGMSTSAGALTAAVSWLLAAPMIAALLW